VYRRPECNALTSFINPFATHVPPHLQCHNIHLHLICLLRQPLQLQQDATCCRLHFVLFGDAGGRKLTYKLTLHFSKQTLLPTSAQHSEQNISK
jgi:hypothetical protein